MLDDAIKAQLQAHFGALHHPVELVADLDDSPRAREIDALLAQLAELGAALVRVDGAAAQGRRPAFTVRRAGAADGVHFACLPSGRQFTSLVLAILQAGGVAPRLDAALAARVAALEGDWLVETYIATDCFNCPDVVQALNAMAALNPRIRHVVVDGAMFRSEAERRDVRAVPMLFVNGAHAGQGRLGVEDVLALLAPSGGMRTT